MSRAKLVSRMARNNHPPIKGLIPGLGGPAYMPEAMGRDNSRQHKEFGPPPQHAPYKKGQAARSRRLRRHTRPTPGSAYNRNRPHLD